MFVEKSGFKNIWDHLRNPDTELIALNEAWREILPVMNFGVLDAITANPHFVKEYKQRLEQAYLSPDSQPKLDDWLSSQTSVPYTIHGFEAETDDESTKQVIRQHQSEFLTQIEAKLSIFEQQLQTSQVHDAIKQAFADCVQNARLFCLQAREIGTPGFTGLQTTNERWQQLLDPVSLSQGVTKLRYEEAALAVLIGSRSRQKEIQKSDSAWDFLGLEVTDFPSPEKYEQYFQATEFGSEELKFLFELFLQRAGIAGPNGWSVKIVERGVAMMVNGAGKQITIPRSERMPRDVALWGIPHELLHVLRGENGSRQQVPLFQTGTVGYETTEEGVALLTELLAGEPFGHDRQVKMAARYFAIAQSIKTKTDDQGRQSALYSNQEIYNQLRDYGVVQADAADILWRIQRGTTLKRQVAHVNISVDEQGIALPVTETFVKDTIYFEGQMAIFDFLKQQIPWGESSTHRQVTQAVDLNPRFLSRMGKAVFDMFNSAQPIDTKVDERLFSMKEAYDHFTHLGKEAVFLLIEYLSVGKLKLEELHDPNWQQIFKRDDLVSFKQFFHR